MSVRHIEMTWRCSSCEHRNLGRYKTCQTCQNPKDRSEKYEMPEDPSKAVSVADAALKRMAEAGPNWRCAYCGSDQRKTDKSCAECGASAVEGKQVERGGGSPQPPAAQPPKRRTRWPMVLGAVGALASAGYLWTQRTREFEATVKSVRWEQRISINKYKIWNREGFRSELPDEAFEIRSLGQKIHHYDKVLDHYETEHYTERVSDGEDCEVEPQTCSETCSDNGNGFATCRTTCSGGGRRCTTRYRTEHRTRQVPVYRDEPRYQEAAAYKIWDWGIDRTVTASGERVDDLRWPVEEARLGVGLGEKEEEKEIRVGEYDVVLSYDDGEEILTVAVGEAEFAKFAVGTRHALRLQGSAVWVDEVVRNAKEE